MTLSAPLRGQAAPYIDDQGILVQPTLRPGYQHHLQPTKRGWLGYVLFVGIVALGCVAMAAKQLKVMRPIRTATRQWNDVINFVSGEDVTATVDAQALLLRKQLINVLLGEVPLGSAFQRTAAVAVNAVLVSVGNTAALTNSGGAVRVSSAPAIDQCRVLLSVFHNPLLVIFSMALGVGCSPRKIGRMVTSAAETLKSIRRGAFTVELAQRFVKLATGTAFRRGHASPPSVMVRVFHRGRASRKMPFRAVALAHAQYSTNGVLGHD